MKYRIRIALMRRDFASRGENRFRGESVHQPVAQHFAQPRCPDFCGSLSVATPRFRASGSGQQIRNTLAFERDGVDNFDLRAMRQTQGRMDFALEFIRTREIGLVNDEHLSDLHDTRFKRLDIVSGAGSEHDQSDVRQARDLDFVLPDAHRFDQHHIATRGVEQHGQFGGRARQAT